jgi:LysM repeat protein
VQEGETMSDIAELYDITVDEILALNPSAEPELIRAGEILLVPAATPTPGPTPTGAATATPSGFVIHVVESGETLLAIAEQYSVPLSAIRTANDLAPDDDTIRAGQSLIIPQGTPTPIASPTVVRNTTPTQVARYPAPPLLYPADGTVFAEGEAPVLVQWASVSVLRDNEWYQVSLSQPSGGVVSGTVRTRATAWRVPLDLLQGAEADAGEFQWRVQVVRETADTTYQPAGAPSEIRSFVWQKPTPSPNSTATPTP